MKSKRQWGNIQSTERGKNCKTRSPYSVKQAFENEGKLRHCQISKTEFVPNRSTLHRIFPAEMTDAGQ